LLASSSRDQIGQINIEIKKGLIFQVGVDEPYTGRLIDTLNQKLVEYDVIKGIKNGEFIVHFPNRNVELYGKIKNNKNEGLWKYYYPDGSIECEGFFTNDKVEGEWTWYYPNGNIKETGKFGNQGKRQGIWKFFKSSGELLRELTFINDEVVNTVEPFKHQAI
jgi:antitoxin component YwqK of YwqJK toxin-antitoxin module